MSGHATIEEMRAALLKAGWKLWRKNPTVWQSPWRSLYRGPAGAYKIMSLGTPLRSLEAGRQLKGAR